MARELSLDENATKATFLELLKNRIADDVREVAEEESKQNGNARLIQNTEEVKLEKQTKKQKDEIRELIIRLQKENPTLNYRKIAKEKKFSWYLNCLSIAMDNKDVELITKFIHPNRQKTETEKEPNKELQAKFLLSDLAGKYIREMAETKSLKEITKRTDKLTKKKPESATRAGR